MLEYKPECQAATQMLVCCVDRAYLDVQVRNLVAVEVVQPFADLQCNTGAPVMQGV